MSLEPSARFQQGVSPPASFNGCDEIYRYWGATACVEFGLYMTHRALHTNLREWTAFLRRDLAFSGRDL